MQPTHTRTESKRNGGRKNGKKGTGWETLLCALSYLFPVWVFGLFFIRRSRRIHFHICQAANLSITTLIYFILVSIIGFVINRMDWRYSYLSGIFSVSVAVLYGLLGALAIVRVIKRNNRPLPFVMRFVRPR